MKVEFDDRRLAFFVVFYRKKLDKLIENTEKNLNKKVDDKVDDKVKLTKNQKLIIALINENPYILRESISEKMGISITSVSNNLKKLVEKGLVKRIGSNKNGYWQIIKNR